MATPAPEPTVPCGSLGHASIVVAECGKIEAKFVLAPRYRSEILMAFQCRCRGGMAGRAQALGCRWQPSMMMMLMRHQSAVSVKMRQMPQPMNISHGGLARAPREAPISAATLAQSAAACCPGCALCSSHDQMRGPASRAHR